MGDKQTEQIDIRARHGHVEVVGMDEVEVAKAIRLYKSVKKQRVYVRRAPVAKVSKDMEQKGFRLLSLDTEPQVRRRIYARRILVTKVSKDMEQKRVRLLSSDTEHQVQRSADLREQLVVKHKAFTDEDLAGLQGIGLSAVRTWISRLRQQGKIFSVDYAGRVLIPAVLLAGSDSIDEQVHSLVAPLQEAQLDEWSIWAWLVSPTGLLSGEIPVEVLKSNPSRARRAAERRAAEIKTR